MEKNDRDVIRLRCLSYRKSGKIVSVCVDLDLFAEAGSFESSKDKLMEAINMYIRHAIEKNEVEELIPRLAPKRYFVMYFLALGISKAGDFFKNIIENYLNYRPYPVPVNLNPAGGTALFG